MSSLPRNEVLVGDALSTLRRLPGDSVDCVMTSPPYFSLRYYGVPGELGTEASIGRGSGGVASAGAIR